MTNSTRYLFFGGSFDPIHHGHLIMSVSAAEQLDAKLVLIPCGDAPHKKNVLPHAWRVRLCQRAVEAHPNIIEVSDIEGRLEGKSYTYNTIKALKDEYKLTEKPYWLIGGDTVEQLVTWHRIDELVNEVNFVVTERPGYTINWARLPVYVQPLQQNLIKVPLLHLSSTDVRKRAEEKKSLIYFVPNEVAYQISHHQLYSKSEGPTLST